MTEPNAVDGVAARAEARRQLLRAAVRSGNVRAAARAASRSRIAALRLDPREAEAARLARRRFGRALRMARAGRHAVAPTPAPATTAPRAPAAARHPRRYAAAAAVAIATLLALLGREALLPAAIADTSDAALAHLICARALKAQGAAPPPQPMIAPAPQYYGPGPIDAAALPSVDPDRAGPIRSGFSRLVGRVVDDVSGLPLDDACLRFGSASAPLPARTDASGIFIIDLVAGRQTIVLVFERPGYSPARISLQPWYERQVRFLFDVRMTAAPPLSAPSPPAQH